MQAQLKSRVVCPVCGKTSITFDPYMFLTVPVPTDNFKTQIITYVPENFNADTFKSFGIKIGKETYVRDLKKKVKTQLSIKNVPIKSMHCADVFNGLCRDKSNEVGMSDLKNPDENDDIFIYEQKPFNQPSLLPADHDPNIYKFWILNKKMD
eukprot:UN26708